MKFTGKIGDDGKLVMLDREGLNSWIASHKGKHIELEVKIKRKHRSNEQNRFYHGVVVRYVCEEFRNLGHDVDEIDTHEFLKGKFNSVKIVNGDGEVEDVPQSTSKMNTVEMMDYIAKIQHWASEFLSLYIPDPNEQLKIEIKE